MPPLVDVTSTVDDLSELRVEAIFAKIARLISFAGWASRLLRISIKCSCKRTSTSRESISSKVEPTPSIIRCMGRSVAIEGVSLAFSSTFVKKGGNADGIGTSSGSLAESKETHVIAYCKILSMR